MTALKAHQSKQEVSDQRQQPPSKALTSRNTVKKQDPAIMITSKEQILSKYLNVFEGISRFPCLPYHIQVDMNITPKQTPCRPVLIHLKEAFKKEINKMLQASVLMKTTAVVESLSYYKTNVLFQRIPTYCKIYSTV